MGGEAGDTKDVSTLETRRALWQQWVCGCKACSCACERVRRYVWREVAASGSRTRSEEQTGERRPAERADTRQQRRDASPKSRAESSGQDTSKNDFSLTRQSRPRQARPDGRHAVADGRARAPTGSCGCTPHTDAYQPHSPLKPHCKPALSQGDLAL